MWKQIPDFPNYSISDTGEVKNNQRNQLLSIAYNQRGYAIVQLWKNGKGYMKRVHRLVLEAFNPIQNSKDYEVNHKDCNIKNNNLNNLEWCTSQENIHYRDKLEHTRKRKVKVTYPNGNIEIYDSVTKCAEHFGISDRAIRDYIKYNLSSKRKIQADFTYL